MANLATTSLSSSTSSLWYHSTKPNSLLNLTFKLKSYPSSTTRTTTSMAATTATKVIPSVIVGGGRVGKALRDMGIGKDLLVKRGEPVPIDFQGPIFVCTRNDDLDAVLRSTPESRWNGTIRTLRARGLSCQTQIPTSIGHQMKKSNDQRDETNQMVVVSPPNSVVGCFPVAAYGGLRRPQVEEGR